MRLGVHVELKCDRDHGWNNLAPGGGKVKRMNKRLVSVVGLLLLALVIAACGGGGARVGGGNGGGSGDGQLRISISADPTEVVVGESIKLTATLSGPGAEGAKINWSASSNVEGAGTGTFSPTSGREVTWTAPNSEGAIEIRASVSGKSVFDRVTINVIKVPHVATGPEPSLHCTKDEPCKIWDFDDLKAINDTVNSETNVVIGYYRLAADIDVSSLPDTGRVFAPIGGGSRRGFSGHFDGDIYTITGLLIDTSDNVALSAGFFDMINPNGVVTNVTLENIDVKGANLTGGLAAGNQGTITNSSVAGKVAKTEGLYSGLGGLVGHNSEGARIEDSQANVQLVDKVKGYDYGGSTFMAVGGLVGRNAGEIVRSNSEGTLQAGEGNRYVGGLVGHNENGTIYDLWSNVTVDGSSVSSTSAVGGLVGFNVGPITLSTAAGDVTGEDHVGGLVGWHAHGKIDNSDSTGVVVGNNKVGGLVGFMSNADALNASELLITHSHSGSNVKGGKDVGGLVGFNDAKDVVGTIEDSYSENAIVTGGESTGGLVGTNQGVIRRSHNRGSEVTGDGDRTGGLVGYNNGLDGKTLIENSSNAGMVTGTGWVGGLIGHNTGARIVGSRSTGDVKGATHVGGLVGTNGGTEDAIGLIDTSFSIGKVTGTGDRVGGLVGFNGGHGFIGDSYSRGSVEGNNVVGGLVGRNERQIANSYSTGGVTATGSDVGGLVGFVPTYGVYIVSNSYWELGTDGDASTAGGKGKSSTQMKEQGTYTNWDFDFTWEMGSDGYPDLVDNPRD